MAEHATHGKRETPAKGFFQQVYALTALIPAGKIMTYGQMARVLGGVYSAKLVGFAMSSAPEGLPCHRVVNRLGEMAPRDIFGGEAQQRTRLREEGVPILPDGRVNVARARFEPAEELLAEICK